MDSKVASEEYLNSMVEIADMLYRKGRADMLTLLERKKFGEQVIKKYQVEAKSTYADVEVFRKKYPQLQS